MISSCEVDRVRRARPLLGTFVEIRAKGENALAAVERAFEAIEKVEEQMSFFRPGSDVSRFNRAPIDTPLQISPFTWQVLKCAQEIGEASGGIFNITIAPQLQNWGYLPRTGRGKWRNTSCRDFSLLPGFHVVAHQPLQVDLGGIAKGFAVDCAVEILQAGGISEGAVNAGGDLRIFGSQPEFTHLRHPRFPGQFLRGPRLKNAALATSATTFSQKQHWCRTVSPLINGKNGHPFRNASSVSVSASTAMIADALTKVCLFADDEALRPILAQFQASCWKVSADVPELRCVAIP